MGMMHLSKVKHLSRCSSNVSRAVRLMQARSCEFSTTAEATGGKERSPLVSLKLNSEFGVATLTMQNPPVNSLSLEMFQSLSESIKIAEATSGIKSLVLESSLTTTNIFSAGLDLQEFLRDKQRLSEFWFAFQQLYLDLYGSRLGCVAAIQGAAPAAGCMLALSCDYRILSSQAKVIGLNETKLGIAAPSWLGRLFRDTVGHRQGELGLALGTLYSPQQALAIGLVDEVVGNEKQDPQGDPHHVVVAKRAWDVALDFAKIPPKALQASKLQSRQDALNRLANHREEDVAFFVNFITQDQVQAGLKAYVQGLKKKSGQ